MKYTVTDKKLKDLKPQAKAFKVADGGGLYVLVSTTGTKAWRFNYRFNGSYKTLALGIYPDVSIKDARNAHGDAVDAIAQGIDPTTAKRNEKAELAARPTFRQVAAVYLTEQVPTESRAKKTADRDKLMVGYLNNAFGDVLFADLRVRHLADLLSKFQEAKKFATRIRVQGAARAIAGFAVGRGVIELNPFSEIRYSVAFRTPKGKKRPAIVEPEAFGHLLRKIDHFEGREGNITGIALRLLALVFVRPGELTAAKWAHFDLDGAKWSVPFEQLKQRTQRTNSDSERADEPHEVPLSRQALALLRDLHKLTGGGEYLFPGRQGARSMNENTLNNSLHALNYQGVHCAHGFRSSASTILNKQRRPTGGRLFEQAMIELQLDHADDSTRAIYDRDGLWDDRVELMQHWADLIDRLRSGNTPSSKPRLVAVA